VVAAAAVAEAQSAGQRQGVPVTTPPQSKASGLKAGTAVTPAPAEAQAPSGSAEGARDAEAGGARAALERRLVETAAALASHAQGLTYVAIGLIVATAALWVLSFLQSRDLRAAVVAVQESSAAARQGVELMQRALVVTQRATVIAGEPKAVWLRDADGRLVGCRLLVTWHNVGNTPTRDMVAAVAGQAAEKPPSQASALPDANVRRQPAIVGPNAVINSAYVNLPIGLVADILHHRAYYLFAGWAEYNDVFDGTPRHRVEFCYWLEFEGDLEAQRLEARFHVHGSHNRHGEAEAPPRVAADGGGARVAEAGGNAAAATPVV
jgi:hypothetical protein